MKMKKLDPIKHEDLLKMAEQPSKLDAKFWKISREILRINTRMKKEKIKCSYWDMDQEMTQSHCLDCSTWGDIKKGLDVTNINDMVKFFQRLLLERAKKDDEANGLKLNTGRTAGLLELGETPEMVEGAPKCIVLLYLENCAVRIE